MHDKVLLYLFLTVWTLRCFSRRAESFVGKKDARAILRYRDNLWPCRFQLSGHADANRTRATPLCVGINYILEYTRSIVAKQYRVGIVYFGQLRKDLQLTKTASVPPRHRSTRHLPIESLCAAPSTFVCAAHARVMRPVLEVKSGRCRQLPDKVAIIGYKKLFGCCCWHIWQQMQKSNN